MKIALLFLLFCAKNALNFKIIVPGEKNNSEEKVEEFLNAVTKEGEDVNVNLFVLSDLKQNHNKFQKRRDAVIGTEYWGRKKKYINHSEWLKV